jgi:hypothetical protein
MSNTAKRKAVPALQRGWGVRAWGPDGLGTWGREGGTRARRVLIVDYAPALWDAWVGQGGEGIVLKERTSLYRSGVRLARLA